MFRDELEKATYSGDLAAIKKIPMEHVLSLGEELLRLSVTMGHYEIAKYLLEDCHIKINKSDTISDDSRPFVIEIGTSILVDALLYRKNQPIAKSNHLEKLFDLLIAHGADINKLCEQTGYNPLHALVNWNLHDEKVQSQRINIIKKLLAKKNIIVDQKSLYSFTTPLFLAAMNGHLEACHLLISADADLTKECNTSLDQIHTPISIAIKCGHDETAKQLIEVAIEKAKDGNFQLQAAFGPALLTAIQSSAKMSIVKTLIENKVDLNYQDQITGNTCLHILVERILYNKSTSLQELQELLNVLFKDSIKPQIVPTPRYYHWNVECSALTPVQYARKLLVGFSESKTYGLDSNQVNLLEYFIHYVKKIWPYNQAKKELINNTLFNQLPQPLINMVSQYASQDDYPQQLPEEKMIIQSPRSS